MAFLLKDVTTPTTSVGLNLADGKRSVQVWGSVSSGTGLADISVEVSNDNEHWVKAADIFLDLSTVEAVDGLSMSANWSYIRCVLDSISGTNAKISAVTG